MADPSRPVDTAPEALERQFDLYRRMSPAEKAQLCRDASLAATAFAMAGLRQRHPDATERELLLRLAVMRLGAEVVERVYGWRRSPDGA
jgi:hypothetical protein